MKRSPKQMDTSAAVKYMRDYADRVGVEVSSDQCLLLISGYKLTNMRAITRAVALLHLYTSSHRLDALPRAHSEGVLGSAPSIILSYLLSDVSDQAREILASLWLVEEGLTRARLTELFAEESLEDLLSGVHVLVQRRLVLAEEPVLWRIPAAVRERLDVMTLSAAPRALIARHVSACHARFGDDLLPLYDPFPSPVHMADLWASREELFTLARMAHGVDPTAAARVLLVLAPAALSLGGRAALDELATHVELCQAGLEGQEEYVHLRLLEAELLFRQRGELDESVAILAQVRREFIDEHHAHGHLLELCLLQREIVYEGLMGDYGAHILEGLEELERLSARPDVPGFLMVQSMRLAHRVHDEFGHRERAIELLEGAIAEAERRELGQSVLLCKMELLNFMVYEQGLERAHRIARELLREIDPGHSPRMYFITKYILGVVLYMQGEKLGEASLQLTQTSDYMRSAQDARLLTMVHQILALCELEQGRHVQALEWQERVGWPLCEGGESAGNNHWWVPLLGALVYAWCGERFLSQRMLLDARRYVSKRALTPAPWILDWTERVHELLCAVHRDSGVEHALRAYHEVTDRRQDLPREFEEHVHFTKSVERYLATWMQESGHTLERVPTLEVDASALPSSLYASPGGAISLARRTAMRRVLGALITRHQLQQSAGMLSTDELFEAGWPGDLATPDSQRARVYNTISRMRKLGLDPFIVHDGEGYGLDPDCVVRVLDS